MRNKKNNTASSSTSFRAHTPLVPRARATRSGVHPTGNAVSHVVSVSFRVQPDLKDRLFEVADSEGVSASRIIRSAVDSYVRTAKQRKAEEAQRAADQAELVALRARVREYEHLATVVKERNTRVREANQAVEMFLAIGAGD